MLYQNSKKIISFIIQICDGSKCEIKPVDKIKKKLLFFTFSKKMY